MSSPSSPQPIEEPVNISIDITPEMIRQSFNDIPIIKKISSNSMVDKIVSLIEEKDKELKEISK